MNNDLIIILATPLVVIVLFQISSYLNQTFLSTGMASLELDEIANLLKVSPESLRMIPLPNEQVKFKVMATNDEVIGEITFSLDSLKVIDKKNFTLLYETARLISCQQSTLSSTS